MSFATCSVGRRAGHGLRYAQVVDVALGEAAIVVDDRRRIAGGRAENGPDKFEQQQLARREVDAAPGAHEVKEAARPAVAHRCDVAKPKGAEEDVVALKPPELRLGRVVGVQERPGLERAEQPLSAERVVVNEPRPRLETLTAIAERRDPWVVCLDVPDEVPDACRRAALELPEQSRSERARRRRNDPARERYRCETLKRCPSTGRATTSGPTASPRSDETLSDSGQGTASP
jgi:hypothetical protein